MDSLQRCKGRSRYPPLPHEAGLTTSLDTNHDASGRWGETDGLWAEVLPLVDLFLPNEREACAIAGTASLDDAFLPLPLFTVVHFGLSESMSDRGADACDAAAACARRTTRRRQSYSFPI